MMMMSHWSIKVTPFKDRDPHPHNNKSIAWITPLVAGIFEETTFPSLTLTFPFVFCKVKGDPLAIESLI